MLLDVAEPKSRLTAEDFEHQVLASADALGHRYRFDREHGHHVAMLATRLFDELRDEHGLGDRERLLLQVAALLHDIGIYVSLRAHHKHSQYILAASQIFGLSDDETAIVSNIARYHRRGLPQDTHLPFIALDRQDRLIVNKLAAILRVANALDAEHAQKVRDVRLVRGATTWTLELDGEGDLTMEQLAATARADMFAETFGRQLVVRPARVMLVTSRDRALHQPRAVVARLQRARARGSGRPDDAAARAGQVRGHRRVEPRRVLHGAGRRGPARSRRGDDRRPIWPA